MLPQSVIEDLFAPDPNKAFASGEKPDPYEYLLIDGGGLVTTAWSTHRKLDDPVQRIRAAVYVCVTTIAGLAKLVSDDCKIIVAWDGQDNRAWRRGHHPWYKHGRGSVINREECRAAIKVLSPLLSAIGAATLEVNGREADDVVATLSNVIAYEKNKTCLIFSDDRDYIQLVADRVHLCRRSLNGIILRPEYCEIMDIPYGLEYLLIKAVMGDPGDNIRGIAGIGEIKARKLIEAIPDFIDTARMDPDLIDWSVLPETLVNAFARGGEELVHPGKYPDPEWLAEFIAETGMQMPPIVEATLKSKLDAVARASAKFLRLVELDTKVELPKFVFPAINLDAIHPALRKLDLSDEDDLVASLYILARLRNPNITPPRRATTRVGDML